VPGNANLLIGVFVLVAQASACALFAASAVPLAHNRGASSANRLTIDFENYIFFCTILVQF
jgi:hypothetical protein